VISGRFARLLLFAALLGASSLGVAAPAALAADGVGLWGPTDDKVVTYWGFGCIIFFAVLVTVLSLIQIRLESRKERLRREVERLRPPAAE
jgi:uncharacterized BrkB/YihY/UPF0761 family membrane protein